jgi:hypothetical protein
MKLKIASFTIKSGRGIYILKVYPIVRTDKKLKGSVELDVRLDNPKI